MQSFYLWSIEIKSFLNLNNQLSTSGNKDLVALDIYSLIVGVTEGKLGSFGVTFKIFS